MNGSYLPVNESDRQDQVLGWLGDNAETWSESYTFAEDTDQEDAITWLKDNGLAEDSDQEDAMDWVKGIGTGAATGAVAGAPGGIYGMAIGAALGAGLGAYQTYQQQQQQQKPSLPQQQQRPPQQQQKPSPPPPQTPSPASAPPQTGGGDSRDSAQSSQALQQLVQLLPLLTQLLAQQQSKQKASGEASGDDVEGEESGDYVSDEAYDSISSSLDQFTDRGIERPIPRESRVQESETVPAPEYPIASRFVPAASNNYRQYVGNSSNPYRPINRIVIHITDGNSNINGTVSWFSNPTAGVSAHYIVGQDGEVVQIVRHNDVAYHAHSANRDSIGIEHVARTPGEFRKSDPGLYPTDAQYCSSAALVRWLCKSYGIPIDRVHILGHSEADPQTTHTGCPNSVWDWNYYMSLVMSGQCLPRSKSSGNRLESEAGEPPRTGTSSYDFDLPVEGFEWSTSSSSSRWIS